MPNSTLRLALGITTGAVGLIAMIRLVSGAFSQGPTSFAWMAILLAMIPWVAYCAWRARRPAYVEAQRGGGARIVFGRTGHRVAVDAGPRRRLSLLTGRLRCHLGERFAASAVAWR